MAKQCASGSWRSLLPVRGRARRASEPDALRQSPPWIRASSEPRAPRRAARPVAGGPPPQPLELVDRDGGASTASSPGGGSRHRVAGRCGRPSPRWRTRRAGSGGGVAQRSRARAPGRWAWAVGRAAGSPRPCGHRAVGRVTAGAPGARRPGWWVAPWSGRTPLVRRGPGDTGGVGAPPPQRGAQHVGRTTSVYPDHDDLRPVARPASVRCRREPPSRGEEDPARTEPHRYARRPHRRGPPARARPPAVPEALRHASGA